MIRACALILCFAAATLAGAQARVVQITANETIAPTVAAIAKEYEKFKKGVDLQITSQAEGGRLNGNQIIIGPSEMVAQVESRRVFARDPIVVAASANQTKITKFAHLASNVDVTWPSGTTLAGRHAQALLSLAGASFGKDWLENIERNKKESPRTSSDVVDAVLQGKVDAGITNLSAVKPHTAKLLVIYLPTELVENVEYVAVAKPGTQNVALANDFIEFLFKPGNQLRIEAAGFISPLRPPPEIKVTKPSGMLRLFTSALSTHPKEVVSARSSSGARQAVSGVSLSQILKDEDDGSVTFTSADGTQTTMDLQRLRADGAVLVRMSDGNYQVVLGKKRPSQWVRWLRRIDLK